MTETRPPEAVLIRRARLASKLSPEDAAPQTGVIKARRWRQIEDGAAGGRPTRGEDDVIAHMAAVVGVTPDQLTEAGRSEAAEILREIERRRALTVVPDNETSAYLGLPPDMTIEERRTVLNYLEVRRAAERAAERRGA